MSENKNLLPEYQKAIAQACEAVGINEAFGIYIMYAAAAVTANGEQRNPVNILKLLLFICYGERKGNPGRNILDYDARRDLLNMPIGANELRQYEHLHGAFPLPVKEMLLQLPSFRVVDLELIVMIYNGIMDMHTSKTPHQVIAEMVSTCPDIIVEMANALADDGAEIESIAKKHNTHAHTK